MCAVAHRSGDRRRADRGAHERGERAGNLTIRPVVKTGLTPTIKTISASVVPDTSVEGNETLHVVLSNPPGGYALGTSVATGTIIDDDGEVGLRVGIGDASVTEGNSGAANR